MKNPTPAAQSILNILVRGIGGRFEAGRAQSYLGYKEVHDELKLGRLPFGMTYGEHLQANGLEDLAVWTKGEGHPAITGLIVDQRDYLPGPGYFTLFERANEDKPWWSAQVSASLHYNWHPYVGFSDPPSPEPTPPAVDLAPPEHVETIVYRVLRDSEKALLVKRNHKYRCQICGHRIELSDRYYAEAHHIKPLGHDGPDDISNILCVCPNCHAMLDYGALRLDLKALPQVGHHAVGLEFVDYHNTHVFRG